jgi:hypothetical protein
MTVLSFALRCLRGCVTVTVRVIHPLYSCKRQRVEHAPGAQDEIGWDKAHVVGFSMGGMVASKVCHCIFDTLHLSCCVISMNCCDACE